MNRKATLRQSFCWLALTMASACGDPCRDLSEAVCRCAPSREEQQRCIKHVRALANLNDKSDTAQARTQCAAMLQSCTCEALANGDLKACGLASE